MGTSHFGEKLVSKTTVVVGKDGSAHAESFLETIPVSLIQFGFMPPVPKCWLVPT